MALDQPSVDMGAPFNPASEFPFGNISWGRLERNRASFEIGFVDMKIVSVSRMEPRQFIALQGVQRLLDQCRFRQPRLRP